MYVLRFGRYLTMGDIQSHQTTPQNGKMRYMPLDHTRTVPTDVT